MERKKQGQILSLLLDERLVDHRVVVDWVDSVIQESENPENWLAEISLSTSEDTDRVVYLLWSNLGYEYSWDFTEYIALVSHQYQKNGLPLHNCLIHLYRLSRDFLSPGYNGENKIYKEKISSLFHILDSFDYAEESVRIIENEFETLVQQAQNKHTEILRYFNILLDLHSRNHLPQITAKYPCQMKLQ
ncbi:MAG: hypothetical protein V2I36_03335 [Desulfopila sp.]|jgi:hypothetical protein|nr:hypothetical protein [Desulfopila sp.]